jgi:hypothetical protein
MAARIRNCTVWPQVFVVNVCSLDLSSLPEIALTFSQPYLSLSLSDHPTYPTSPASRYFRAPLPIHATQLPQITVQLSQQRSKPSTNGQIHTLRASQAHKRLPYSIPSDPPAKVCRTRTRRTPRTPLPLRSRSVLLVTSISKTRALCRVTKKNNVSVRR